MGASEPRVGTRLTGRRLGSQAGHDPGADDAFTDVLLVPTVRAALRKVDAEQIEESGDYGQSERRSGQ